MTARRLKRFSLPRRPPASSGTKEHGPAPRVYPRMNDLLDSGLSAQDEKDGLEKWYKFDP
jgi:hypothetical protein